MIIRQYQLLDLEEVKNLHILALKNAGAFYESGSWDADLDHIEERYIHRGGEFLVGFLDGKLIAMGALKKNDNKTCEVKRMRVHPDYQRRGYGQIMLAKLEKRAEELGYKNIQLDTTIKQRPAQAMYLKNGYAEIRRETEGWPLETIFYQKEL